MDINAYSLYSTVSQTEEKHNKDLEKVTEIVDKLYKLESAESVKAWLNETWGLKDDISDFIICANACITTNSTGKYYNVTLSQENSIKSFNYNK